MARTLVLRIARPLADHGEVLRAAIVTGCALVLILAGPVLPPLGL